MKNIDQIRARNALDCTVSCPESERRTRCACKQGNEGNCLSGYPSLVIGNGLLACLAFSIDKGKQHLRVANAVAYHLADLGVVPQRNPSAEALRDALAARTADALLLQRATDESLAFLAFLKRFAS